MNIDYKFDEPRLLQQLKEYIDKTYDQHYSKKRFQSIEFTIDSGHGMGFTMGNIQKYNQRYGNKDGYNRDDIMKILHYGLLALHVHDLNHGETSE
jgi:hypothetical protein